MKFPRHLEAIRQMCRERFDTESLRRVMAAEQQVDSEFFRRDRRPMRRFAGDESIDTRAATA